MLCRKKKSFFALVSRSYFLNVFIGVPVSRFCHPNFSPQEPNMNITDGKNHIFSNRKKMFICGI